MYVLYYISIGQENGSHMYIVDYAKVKNKFNLMLSPHYDLLILKMVVWEDRFLVFLLAGRLNFLYS